VVSNNYHLKQIRRSDSVVIINGPLNNVIKASEEILNRMNEYYKKNHKNYSDYSVKIIIGSLHVSKIIGKSK
jgi:hypothetical protein